MRQSNFLKAIVILAGILIIPVFYMTSPLDATATINSTNFPSKQAAFKVLDTKCNSCHRKQNPFKIFSTKNMDKHASKIHQQVFVKRRMPKGDQIKLTIEEYNVLKNWLHTINIF